MLSINHSLVPFIHRCNYKRKCFGHFTVGAADAELSRLHFFVCGVSDACDVVLQCGGHEQAVIMECAAWMRSKFTHKCYDA